MDAQHLENLLSAAEDAVWSLPPDGSVRARLVRALQAIPGTLREVTSASTPEPSPAPEPGVQGAHDSLAIRMGPGPLTMDLMERRDFGLRKYGTMLTPSNGRDHAVDALQELLDCLAYLECLRRQGHPEARTWQDVVLVVAARVRDACGWRPTEAT